MEREISSGGLVIRRIEGEWVLAVIEPRREHTKTSKLTLALPKGLVDKGECPEETALREVHEETGIVASQITKLADIKYVYVRSWGNKERVFKIVSFYLLKYESGNIGEIAPEMQIEVKQALWIPLKDAARKLAYKGEKEMAKRAQEYLSSHPED